MSFSVSYILMFSPVYPETLFYSVSVTPMRQEPQALYTDAGGSVFPYASPPRICYIITENISSHKFCRKIIYKTEKLLPRQRNLRRKSSRVTVCLT